MNLVTIILLFMKYTTLTHLNQNAYVNNRNSNVLIPYSMDSAYTILTNIYFSKFAMKSVF